MSGATLAQRLEEMTAERDRYAAALRDVRDGPGTTQHLRKRARRALEGRDPKCIASMKFKLESAEKERDLIRHVLRTEHDSKLGRPCVCIYCASQS